MEPLYELTHEYRSLLESENLTEQALDAIADKFETKAARVAAFIKAQEALSAYLSENVQRLKKRKQAVDRRVEWLRAYLARNMAAVGISKIDDPLVPISLQDRLRLKVWDEDKIPMGYYISKMELDRTALREALEEGEEIDGVVIESTPFVRIG